jgi:hypothetical protein
MIYHTDTTAQSILPNAFALTFYNMRHSGINKHHPFLLDHCDSNSVGGNSDNAQRSGKCIRCLFNLKSFSVYLQYYCKLFKFYLYTSVHDFH